MAQLGARLNGIQEVTGSNPVRSTNSRNSFSFNSLPTPTACAQRRSESTRRVTMSYMKTSTITIRLDDALGRELDQACARTGRTRSDLARDALRRQLALLRFERVRRRVLPLAESQGYLTDDDVFRDVS